MTTSGSSSFTLTRDQLITAALRMLGVVAQGETPTATQITEAAEALNLMIKSFEADGMPQWGLTETAVTLVNGKSEYTVGTGKDVDIPKPLKVIQAWNRTTATNVDIPMRIVTKQEYNILGNKTSSGNPIQLYYQPLVTHGVLKLFPVPTNTEASANKVYLVYQRPFEDFLASGDTADFPQEWLEAIKYGLAARLAPEYGVPIELRQLISKEAGEVKNYATSFGTEEGSLYMGVDRRGW